MKTITKDECQAIIERLADTRLTPGCRFQDDLGNIYVYGDEPFISKNWTLLGHPVVIGQVLLKISRMPNRLDFYYSELLLYWERCGFAESLDDLLADAIPHECTCDTYAPEPYCDACMGIIRPSVTGLFYYLREIGL